MFPFNCLSVCMMSASIAIFSATAETMNYSSMLILSLTSPVASFQLVHQERLQYDLRN